MNVQAVDNKPQVIDPLTQQQTSPAHSAELQRLGMQFQALLNQQMMQTMAPPSFKAGSDEDDEH